ncbi:hypothetical protein DPMN_023655 [Dreissena polymorpha]|uniref:Uncharacterized protein n=1 Tax=Dreissena polymorpha TaxID=45954 RepID=A0A9D4LMN7_DREPO|nr:hypothetical protein DPMN_023655 [Dreissena polymorpha]
MGGKPGERPDVGGRGCQNVPHAVLSDLLKISSRKLYNHRRRTCTDVCATKERSVSLYVWSARRYRSEHVRALTTEDQDMALKR